MVKKYFLIISIFTFLILINSAEASTLEETLKGKVILEVEKAGEAWYVNPATLKRHYLGKPDDAFSLMRNLGHGIKNEDLNKIPVAEMNMSTCCDDDGDGLSVYFESAFGTNKNNIDTDNDSYDDKSEILNGYNPAGAGTLGWDLDFAKIQAGKVLLQVEENGEAWYVSPDDNRRYFLGRPIDAFNVMRFLGLGISNQDIALISTDFDQGEFVDLEWRYNINKDKYTGKGYKRSGDKIVFQDEVVIELNDADLESFEVLHFRYAKDNNAIYDRGEISFDYLDSQTFNIIVTEQKSSPYYSLYYYLDSSGVYDKLGKLISVIDPETLAIVPDCYPYTKDKKNYYFYNKVVEDVDFETFEIIECDGKASVIGNYKIDVGGYALVKDQYHVYYQDQIIKNADPKTIEFLGGTFSKDKFHVYDRGKVIEHIDVEGFQFLPYRYSKNLTSVFREEVLIEGADPDSFEALDVHYSKDKNNVYYMTNILEGADLDSFIVPTNPGSPYAKDKNNIYKYGEIVPEHPGVTF